MMSKARRYGTLATGEGCAILVIDYSAPTIAKDAKSVTFPVLKLVDDEKTAKKIVAGLEALAEE